MKTPTLHVGRAVLAGPVTLFPIWAEVNPVRGLLTGADASVDITELDGQSVVNRLSVYNPGPRPVLLLEGELMEGGWQTRACVRDEIVSPGTRREIEVVCVEEHRWSGTARHERRARRTTRGVQSALRSPELDRQGRVWNGVRHFESTTGPTGTGSLADHLDRVGPLRLPRPVRGQNGVIVGVAGQPVALELFGSTPALRAHLPGILAAAQLEATLGGPAAPVPGRRARRFAARIGAMTWEPDVSEVGTAWTASGEHVSLRALTAGSGLAHVSAVTA